MLRKMLFLGIAVWMMFTNAVNTNAQEVIPLEDLLSNLRIEIEYEGRIGINGVTYKHIHRFYFNEREIGFQSAGPFFYFNPAGFVVHTQGMVVNDGEKLYTMIASLPPREANLYFLHGANKVYLDSSTVNVYFSFAAPTTLISASLLSKEFERFVPLMADNSLRENKPQRCVVGRLFDIGRHSSAGLWAPSPIPSRISLYFIVSRVNDCKPQ